jgi:hypothetical protein
LKQDKTMMSNERYEVSDTPPVNTYSGNVVDDNDNESNNNSIMLSEGMIHRDESADFKYPSDHTNLIYPWVEVMDPDTEEIFYWNEETEEMRWEL